MASAARAYDYYGTAAPKRPPRTDPRPDVRVLPGRNTDRQTLPPALVTGFKLVMASVAMLLAVCGLRVWLSASTVQVLQNVQTLETSIERAYADGSELEVEHSVLASTSRIHDQAKSLGMVSPKKKAYITVDFTPQVVTNRNGTISLSRTLANIEKSHAAAR